MMLLSLVSLNAMSQRHLHEGRKQQNEENYETLKAKKVAFITSKVNFTVEEAEKFWPLYNELEEKINNVRKEQRKLRKAAHQLYKEGEDVSNDEIKAFLEDKFNYQQQELDLKKAFYEKIKAFLPMKKVGKYYKAQHEFKREVLRAYRKNRR